jgi:LysM repeat protein
MPTAFRSSIHLGQNLVIPPGPGRQPPSPRKSSAKVAQKKPATKNTYIVKNGDSLQSIAKKTGVSMALLKETNNLRSPKLKIGQTLNLPGSSAASESAPLVLAKKEADKPTARAYDEEEDLLDEGTQRPSPTRSIVRRSPRPPSRERRGPEERSLFVRSPRDFSGRRTVRRLIDPWLDCPLLSPKSTSSLTSTAQNGPRAGPCGHEGQAWRSS